jgi:septal ring factor EnvC (AmiA/AmiB activator)
VNKGVYWTTGIMLNQTVENTNVTAAMAGTIKEIGYGARKFKYVITEGQGMTIIYSNLISTDKSLAVGKSVAAGATIGKPGGQLRLEVCQGSYDLCADASLGLNRAFRDPSSSLELTCQDELDLTK